MSHLLFSTEQMALDVANNKSSLEGNGNTLPSKSSLPILDSSRLCLLVYSVLPADNEGKSG